jgi:flagellin-like protein
MYIRSISPIIASILIIVMTVAIVGLFYAFTSGIFGSLSSSSNNLVNQQSKIISFTINSVYCSNNILYFDIYNNGNIPININNSQIIFTDNNGNTISINGSNIICNNGNIINIGSNELCYVLNYFCYYSYTDYIKSTNFVYNGISYNYDILNNNKFNIIYNLINYPIAIYNTQSISTPSPFQQDIAICNGSINIGNNFVYVNNPTLFNQINPNGQNVMFFNPNNGELFYSWYEGQLINGSTYCDVWWVNIPNGIPANSNIVIYMAIGSYNTNYYSQYYPYVGEAPYLSSTYGQYDNGQNVFIAYGYFNNTFDGWSGYIYGGSFSPTATSNGIEMINNQYGEGTYILPPNNWNIPEMPLIVEEAWYHTQSADANAISLFGNTNQQILARNVGSTAGGYTPVSNLSTFVQFEYYNGGSPSFSEAAMLKSAVTNQYLNYTYFPPNGGTIYSYLIVNSTYAQTGYYYYNSNQVWASLTLLDTYNVNYNGYTYYNLNYNPYQYPTLEIGAGTGGAYSYQYVEWVIVRAYPPNGVMPSIYIG